MGEVDKVLNEYMKDNARFADFHNLVTFGGRKVLKPDLLEEMDTRVYAKLKNKAVGKEAHFGGQRDLKRRQRIGARFLVTAIEEQSEIHKAMPIRNNLYDAAEYNREYMQIKKNHKEKKDLTGADFIAGFGSEDRITPVITTISIYT